MKTDSIRPKGTVEVYCIGADCAGEWGFWVDCLDPRLPEGPFICEPCQYFAKLEAAKGQKLTKFTHSIPSGGIWAHWEFPDGEVVHYPGEAARAWRASMGISERTVAP